MATKEVGETSSKQALAVRIAVLTDLAASANDSHSDYPLLANCLPHRQQ